MQSGRQWLHIMQHNSRLAINTKEFRLKFITLKESSFTGISLPVAQPPTSGKQLISSYSADQNQAMLYNIHCSSDNISIAGSSVLPSGNNTSEQTYKMDTLWALAYISTAYNVEK